MKVILEAQPVCTSEPRGIPYYAIQLIQRLLERNQNDYALTFFDEKRERNNRQWVDKYFGKYNVPIHECNDLNYRETWFKKDVYQKKGYNAYTGAEGDVFHFLNLTSIPDNLQGKMVVTIHDMLPVRYPEYYHPQSSEMIHVNTYRLNKVQPIVITVSESAKEDIINYAKVPEDRIIVIPVSYHEEACQCQSDPQSLKRLGIEGPYLLYLGAIAKNKNVSRIVDAFEILGDRYPELRLVVAGWPAYHADEAAIVKIKKSRLTSRIIITGYVNDQQKHALYANAVAFLFPSLFEGFGAPVLEAMALGCPVITSNTSSLPEIAGKAAILIDPYDTEQLAHEIERVVSSGQLRAIMRRKGFAQCKKYSWDTVAEKTEEVYRFAANIRE